MDEDHNQEAGFVTEEVNQVVKVIIQIQTFQVQTLKTNFRMQSKLSLVDPNMKAKKSMPG